MMLKVLSVLTPERLKSFVTSEELKQGNSELTLFSVFVA